MAKDPSVKHPEYKLDRERWDMLEDFGEGGRSVLQPGHETGSVSFWNVEREAQTEGQTQVDERATYVAEKSNHYLFSHERESRERWNDRCKRAQHIPVVQPVLNVYTTGILRSAPQRKDLGGKWDTYTENVDLMGQTIDELVFDAVFSGLNLGRFHAITDMPKTDMQLESLADQLDAGIRPYSYLVRPQDLVDWRLDSYGNFLWIVLREEMEPEREPGVEHPGEVLFAYKVWTRDQWMRFEPKTDDKGKPKQGEFEIVDGSEHDLGVVPISTFFAAKRKSRSSIRTRSMVNSLVDIDRAIFNKMSLLDEIDYGQTFSQLAIPDATHMGIHGLRTGIYEAFTFDPEGGPPIYLAPDPSMAQGLWVRIVELFHTARVIAGVSRGRAEQSKEERSAAALGQESEEKHTQMVQHATAAEAFERSLYDHAARWLKTSNVPTVEYNRKFEVRSLEEKLSSALSIKSLMPGPVAMAAVNQAVVGEYLRQCGVEDKVIEGALQDIEEYSEEMAAALPQMGADDEEDEESSGQKDE